MMVLLTRRKGRRASAQVLTPKDRVDLIGCVVHRFFDSLFAMQCIRDFYLHDI